MRRLRNNVFVIIILLLFLISCRGTVVNPQITGQVIFAADGKPAPDAIVSIRASDFETISDQNGKFKLSGISSKNVEVTAWLPGYYIASTNTEIPSIDIRLELRPYHLIDNPDYQWQDPTPNEVSEGACGNCHPMIMSQWENNAHGGSIDNPRFYSFYNGINNINDTSVLPSYVHDFPNTGGNCATCHAPGAAIDNPFNTDMNSIRGQTTAGIHCDYCHKVGDIFLDPTTSSPYSNMPGVFSTLVLRPPEGEQIFFGPYADIHDPDTYSPLMHESAYCAPCHSFSFWGTPIYDSYNEWLNSSYSDMENGRTCQDCHMIPNGDEYFAIPEKGGLPHPPDDIPSHLDVGITNETLMQNSIDMNVEVEHSGEELIVNVNLINTEVGHHIPTDHPGRHMLLIVEVIDENGNALPSLGGPIIPSYGGDYAGLSGKIYAKVLKDVETGEFPVVSYWNPTLIVSDNRIPAEEMDASKYAFTTGDLSVIIQVRVLFRRLFQPIAERYGWNLDELIMEEEIIFLGS